MISTEAAYTKKKARVLDYSMRYVDEGSGDPIVLIHDWGSALGFDWALRHPDKVKGIHFIQEDSPDEIGQSIAKFIGRL